MKQATRRSGNGCWQSRLRHPLALTAIMLTLVLPTMSTGFPITLTDAEGQAVVIDRVPKRVVCLVPTITEMIVALGAQDMLKGITYHSANLMAGKNVTLVGGFFSPDPERVAALRPDLVLMSAHQKAVKKRLAKLPECRVITMATRSVADSLNDILRMGQLFDKEATAATIVTDIKSDLALITEKVDRIPENQRKRVMRLMGRDTIMTPGSDSFQNELIRAAGGITPDFQQTGQIISVSLEQWQSFNPQFLYGCGGDRQTAEKFFRMPGWQGVDAAISHSISFFPCDLTCRASTHTGDFVSWLAAVIYTDAFSRKDNLVRPEEFLGKSPVPGDTDVPDYVRQRNITRSRIYDFINKTLIIDFTRPMTILSSLEGMKHGVTSVGNHYMPPPCWPISHAVGLETFREHVMDVIDRDREKSAFLFTGADMGHLAVEQVAFKNLQVWAYVTAGVAGNAVRMSKSTGAYYEPGTINMILMANHKLSERAMTRAVISATEAKTAALLDLDIRVSDGTGAWRATGTGTDNILVVQGTGKTLNNAGGHSKLGELIGRAVHDAVVRAVRGQNHLTVDRDIFQRLEERGLSVGGLIGSAKCDCIRDKSFMAEAVEKILLDSRYAGFIELAFTVSDDYEKGLITDTTEFNRLALAVSREIAGRPVPRLRDLVAEDQAPAVMRTALNAILTGADKRTNNL